MSPRYFPVAAALPHMRVTPPAGTSATCGTQSRAAAPRPDLLLFRIERAAYRLPPPDRQLGTDLHIPSLNTKSLSRWRRRGL